MKIFISYATEDFKKFRIEDIAEYLENSPEIEKVFYWKRDNKSDRSIVEYMEEAVLDSDIFLAISTSSSKSSNPVNQEIDMAVYNNKRIIPIFIDIGDVREIIKPKRGVVFNEENFTDFCSELEFIITGKGKQQQDSKSNSGKIVEKKTRKVKKSTPKMVISNIRIYQGVNIEFDEFNALSKLESLLGSPIPLMKSDKLGKFGFYSRNRHVVGLSITNKKLGYFPDQIGVFEKLEILNLSNNSIKIVPGWINRLKFLKELYLERNPIKEKSKTIRDLKNLKMFI